LAQTCPLPGTLGRLARPLADAGYRGEVGTLYPEDRRFEMWHPSEVYCRFEFHWWLGLPFRMRVEQESLWEESRPGCLEGVECRLLSPEDALLYHVGHIADHYFGPTLKWTIDLREMLRRWKLDPDRLVWRSTAWGVRVALFLSLLQLERLFPGEVPPALAARLAPGRLRRGLLDRWLPSTAAEGLLVGCDAPARFLLRPLLIDRPWDAARLAVGVALRPLVVTLRRASGKGRPPWAW